MTHDEPMTPTEKLDRESLLVVEPTVRAAATRDGDPLHALVLSLPAATA